jgi:hypothetical protein
MSALMIQGNEVACHAIGPYEATGKYGWVIWMLKRGDYHTPILSDDIGHYDTSEEAVKAAEKLVEEVRKADLEKEKEQLFRGMGEMAPLVQEVVRMANEGFEERNDDGSPAKSDES